MKVEIIILRVTFLIVMNISARDSLEENQNLCLPEKKKIELVNN